MNYHVHHQGRDLGSASLEELRRRREAGELSGAEMIWREGMPDWQPLDSILQADALYSSAHPPPLPGARKKGNRLLVGALVAVGLIVVGSLVVVGVVISKMIQRVQEAGQQIGAEEADGLEVVNKKITWPTNTATEADVRKRSREFRTRQWLEGYQANGQRDRACDAEVVQMIEAWIESNFGDQKTNAVDVSLWCDRLATIPACDDPLMLTVAGISSTELHEKSRRLESALAAFPKSRHKAYPKLVAAVNLIDSASDTNRPEAMYGPAMQWLKESFTDGSFRPEDQAEIAEILIHGWGRNFFSRMRANIYPIPRTSGKSFEWLSLVLEGEHHVMEAWKQRGGGYADTVTEKGWQGFNTQLAAANKNFTGAWQLRPDLPLAPERMISVAMSEAGAEEMRVWFDRTLAAQIDYPPAWSNMRWGLRPRWHGSEAALLALGKAAVDTGRFDTDVPRKFFDVVSDVESELELPVGQHIYGRPDIWPDLARMYDGYVAEPSWEKSRTWWRSTYSAVAYLAGKYSVARTQLEALNWEPQAYNLSGWGTDLSLMPLEVAARTGTAGTKVSAAESSCRRGNVNDALQRYQELAADNDERTATFARHRVAALELEKRLRDGEWVNLIPSQTNDPAWMFSFGAVRSLPDGLEVESDKGGHMLYSRARVGMDFEVRGEFEVVKSSTEDFQAGLIMGLPNFNAPGWYSFRMKRNREEGQVASVSIGWGRPHISRPVTLNRTNSFTFKFQNGRTSASVNNTQLFQNQALNRTTTVSPGEFFVGLGAFNDMNDTVLRYRSVQVRRLPPSRAAQRNRE